MRNRFVAAVALGCNDLESHVSDGRRSRFGSLAAMIPSPSRS